MILAIGMRLCPANSHLIFSIQSSLAYVNLLISCLEPFRYPVVPPRLDLESPQRLTSDEVAQLKRLLETRATELSTLGMVMVHDLLV
ncbi:unnamed protein product, partial [Choristocarpus tenellus]